MPELACCRDKAAHHQLPIPAAFWIIGIVSMEKCSSLMQNLMQICCSTHTVILNVMATQYTCTIQWCLQHPLTSTVKSSLLMHAHSSPPSLATRFHWCCTNHYCHINNSWVFFLDTPLYSLSERNNAKKYIVIYLKLKKRKLYEKDPFIIDLFYSIVFLRTSTMLLD